MAKEGLSSMFGKTPEEMGIKTEEVTPPIETQEVDDPKVDEPEKVVEPPKVEDPIKEIKTEPIKEEGWLSELNKKFKTEYKTPEEFGQVFEKAKKTSEYEAKITGFTETEDKYKKQLSELQSSLSEAQNPLSYFSSQESFVAEQLRKQHPDKSPFVLQQIVTSDAKLMDDVDVLIKNVMLDNPDLIGGEQGAREIIFDKYGIDADTPKEEWTALVQNKIKTEARATRKTWDELKTTVELPKTVDPAEREAERTRLQEEKLKQIAPLKETFSKFDKFTVEIEDGKILDFNVPDEYKETLPEMFNTFFVKAGLDVNTDNLAAMEELKQGQMLLTNIKQIYKTIEGDVETRMKAERDKLLGNENPTNTQTGTETGETEDQKFNREHGMRKLLDKWK